ncbi:hypothetical protein ASG67_04335 [Sphingomonas sp. Leaf339]|nr:hypothetical protein ASG67_04335 [Sphingomonas sp. Leaf339]
MASTVFMPFVISKSVTRLTGRRPRPSHRDNSSIDVNDDELRRFSDAISRSKNGRQRLIGR